MKRRGWLDAPAQDSLAEEVRTARRNRAAVAAKDALSKPVSDSSQAVGRPDYTLSFRDGHWVTVSRSTLPNASLIVLENHSQRRSGPVQLVFVDESAMQVEECDAGDAFAEAAQLQAPISRPAQGLVNGALFLLSPLDRERYDEEWAADLAEQVGRRRQLSFALGTLFSAVQILFQPPQAAASVKE